MSDYAKQIGDLQATRKAKAERMKEIQTKATDQARTLDTGEQEEFDSLKGELGTIDKNIGNLRDLEALEKADVATAATVDDTAQRTATISTVRTGVEIKQVEKLEPGIALARYAQCLVKSKGNHEVAFRLAERHFPQTEAVVKTLKAQAEGADLASMFQTKATVAAGTTTESTWAAPLVYANTFAGDFIEYLRPRTLIGQAQFRRVPFNVRIAGQTTGGTAYWVGQGKAKPVTKTDFTATTVPFTKVAAIAVITQELARFSDPNAEALVRDTIADAVVARVDADLFDPDVTAAAGVNPAGLLNGVAPVAGPTGTDPDDIRCALLRLWAPWDATNIGSRPAYYTTPAVARLLAFTRDALGNAAFPGVTPNGGTLDGIPLRVSQYLANNGGSGGAPFVLVDEAEIYLADDGAVTLDASQEASIEMSDTPAGSSSPTVAASSVNFVSMFQTNSIALRAERFIWWGPRRSGAIQWIDGFPTAC